MESNQVPYRKTIFVCTNARGDGRIACAGPGRGGDLICEKLKAEAKKAGLKGKIRVTRSGCLDLCAKGPNLFVYPDGEWLSGVKSEDVPGILKKCRNSPRPDV